MDLNKYIDHTILKPDATENDIIKLCEEAIKYDFMSVCVNPYYVALAKHLLKDSDVLVCTVIGFPLGASETSVKAFETKVAIKDGAGEIDMVINVGALKSGNSDYIYEDIRKVKKACGKILLKVIIETCLLTDEEKVIACEAAVKAGANFVKTSTGFSKSGATVNDIALMRKTVGPDLGVKASGGVRTYEDAIKMIEAGATRIGTSNGIAIIEHVDNDSKSY